MITNDSSLVFHFKNLVDTSVSKDTTVTGHGGANTETCFERQKSPLLLSDIIVAI